jgi:hypothetical protein
MEKITERERAILRHTLGLNYSPRQYRNYFCAEPGSDDYEACCALAVQGYLTRGFTDHTGLVYFHATLTGITVAHWSPNPATAALDRTASAGRCGEGEGRGTENNPTMDPTRENPRDTTVSR